jgi:hypothetical protein
VPRARPRPRREREELEAAVEASAVLIPYEEHREVVHGAQWPRWGRKGGLVTLARYGRSYYRLLALRRHGKITPAKLRAASTAATKASEALPEKAAA